MKDAKRKMDGGMHGRTGEAEIVVSVIIPTCNRKELLDITLDSILSQSRVPDEVIVIDDHSTDGTNDFICNKYKKQVNIILNEGRGPGAGRNTGLKYASGSYIKFFDSDDIMSPNTIETQIKALEDSGEVMVYSPYVHASFENDQWIQKDVILQYYPIPKKMTLRDCIAYGFFTVIPAMMFKRDFLDKVGAWREDIIAYEDWDYLWRISDYVTNPIHTNECLMLYRIHGDQTTEQRSSDVKRDRNKLEILRRVIGSNSLSGKLDFLLKCEMHKTWYRIDSRHVIPLNYSIGLQWKRFRNKIERALTGTNWERMHGVNKNKRINEFSFRH